MFVKQIDMKTAFELALKGIEVKTLVPTGPGSGWTSMEPDTLQNMLADVLFFRQEPAMEVPMVEVKEIKVEGPASLTTHEVEQAIKSSLGDVGNQIPPPQQASGHAGTGAKRKPVDTGKLLALRKAGWSMKKIADELGISEGSVWNYLKKMEGEADEKDKTVSGSASGA